MDSYLEHTGLWGITVDKQYRRDATMNSIIKAKKLTKRYGDFVAVNGIDLDIGEGEIFGLLGPNGAGKTTTMMMLTTLRDITSGKAEVNGFDVSKQPSQVRKSIGIVFQDPSYDENLTAYENLKLHGLLYGVPGKELEKQIDIVLDLVTLSDRKHALVKSFSGGMKRRLEIARGLVHRPKILFLDEPTIGLDPQTRDHIWNYVIKLRKERGTTVIVTTHYMDEAEKLCDRVAIVDHGKIIVIGTPAELKRIIGGDIVVIKASNKKAGALEKLKCVKHVEKKGDELHLSVTNPNVNLPIIIKALGSVDYVEIRSPTLNDVFLHYTGREIREEAADTMSAITKQRGRM